jgi:hypothetical protein
VNLDNEAFHQGATTSAKLRLLADWIDLVDSAHRALAEAFPRSVRGPNGELLAPFCHAQGDTVQQDLRDWAADLEAGFPLYNVPRDPASIPKPGT